MDKSEYMQEHRASLSQEEQTEFKAKDRERKASSLKSSSKSKKKKEGSKKGSKKAKPKLSDREKVRCTHEH